jgi:hypothetical protein
LANTTTQLEAEKWIVENFLPGMFGGVSFAAKKSLLVWGGCFDFDAVSTDGKILGLISTSTARTAGNNFAAGKVQKLKSDTLFTPCEGS